MACIGTQTRFPIRNSSWSELHIPKDQIYQVPPPENASFVEQFDTQMPTFLIQQMVVNKTYLNAEYDFSIRVRNPNAILGINYFDGGDSSLTFKQDTIAVGNFSAFYQDFKETKNLTVVLAGTILKLPKNVKMSLIGKASNIPLTLSISVPANMEFGMLQTWTTHMNILCNFNVDSLANKTRILSQGCTAKF